MSCVLNILAWQRLPNTSNLTLVAVTFCAAVDVCVTSVDCILLILFWSELGVVQHRLFFGLCQLVAALAMHAYNSWATHAMYRSRTDPTCHDSHFGWMESQPHSVSSLVDVGGLWLRYDVRVHCASRFIVEHAALHNRLVYTASMDLFVHLMHVI